MQNKEQLKTALSNAKSNIDRFPEISLQIRVQRFEQSTQLKVDGEAFTQWLSNNNRIPTRFISEQAVMDEVMTVVRAKFIWFLFNLDDVM